MLILPNNLSSTVDKRCQELRHPGVFGAAVVGLLALVVALMVILVTRAATGDVVLTPPTGPASGGTSVTMSATASGGWTNQVVDFPFAGTASTTGMQQTFVVPVTGQYKLETWGAEGLEAGSSTGGKGGYTTTTVNLTAGQTVYISVGGKGAVATGGWNGGGGAITPGPGGGGATHMALYTGTLNTLSATSTTVNAANRSNILVVAGGGGGSQTTGAAGQGGGYGGGTSGGAGSAGTGSGAGGGTQTAGGSAGQNGAAGTFGQGATGTTQGGSNYGGGGGGGYFGGGSGSGRGGHGGGGSSWAPGCSGCATVTAAGYTVVSGSSSTVAGNANQVQPDGTTTTGHAGNGYARITILNSGLYIKPTVQFGSMTIPDVNVTWCNYNGSTCTNGGALNTVTFITPVRGSMPITNNVYLTFDPTKTGEFTYWTPATSYTNQCTTDGGATWGVQRNIPAGVAVSCRVVLNNSFSGTIKLGDNYYNTINPSLSGSFASADPRFNAGNATFTVDYTDTYNTAGQMLEYTYTSPSWSTLVGYWTSSNQTNLMRPRIIATPTPNAGVPDIVLAGDNLVLSILAETYKITNSSTRFCEGCETTFTITTYGAIYSGSVGLSEDLSQSDNPSGTPGILTPTTVNFAGDGADRTFTYTPETTSATPPTRTRISGTSASPAITNNYIDINVTPATMRVAGPTTLHRGEYGDYTLTVYDTSVNSVELTDWLDGSSAAAGGTFVDLSSGGTFNPSTNTYDFTGCTIIGTAGCTRSFRYTVNSNLGNATSYIEIDATADNSEFTFLNVNIAADKITFVCSPSNPDCTIAYVGESQIYNVRPNGIFTGTVGVASTDSGAVFSPSTTISWTNGSTATGINYTPSAPGRYILSANVATSPDAGMNGQTFYSNTADSLNDYIWVIANQTTFFTGDDTIPNGGTGTYTLALNGPFVGTVILSDNDTVNGIPQGGVFDNGGVCNFTFANYDPISNTSTCTFTYTPTVDPEERTITLAPSFPPEFARPMAITPISITVYGFPDIRFISPTEGPSTGGNTVWITGAGLLGVSFITFGGVIDSGTGEVSGGLPCTNLHIISDTVVTCAAPAHAAGTVNVFANNIVPPPDIDDSDPSNPIQIPRDPVQYMYFDVATDFVNQCYVGGVWTTKPYVNPGTTVTCRIVLDGRWNGPVRLSDDWHETINPGLSGAFTSSDARFNSTNDTFDLIYADTADSASQTLEYTWTSPSWSTLLTYWVNSNQDNLWWPMIKVDVPIDEYHHEWLMPSGDNVVFGLLAQEYTIKPDGNYSYYCINCEVDFIVSTYGAPYNGTISVTDILTYSDNPSGTQGVFWAGGVASNPGVMNFAGNDGADNSFSYIPATPATGSGTFIRLQGTSSGPSIADSYYDISPVLDPGITITPATGCSFLSRGQTCSYTLYVEFGAGMSWSGTVVLNDVFNIDSSAGNGVFADVSGGGDGNPGGTFNSGTNTYTFTAGGGETYKRTFTYTLRDDAAVGPIFPSHILQITAESNSPNNQTFTNIFIYANRININCSVAFPTCNIGYVGHLQDYSFTPNGAIMGSATVSASDAGTLSTPLTWLTIAATSHTLSYTPTAPGRQVLTATVNAGSTPAAMANQSFVSTDPKSMNDYIWVMADHMAITGPSYLRYGATGNFTLTMNGPFIGTINLSDFLDVVDGAPAGGAFSPATSCTFALTNYDSATNTTSCTFSYTPDLFEDMTTVVLGPSITSYSEILIEAPLSVVVYGRPLIDAVSPDSGPTTGGTGFGIAHNPNGVITLSGTNLATSSTLNFDSIFMGSIPVSLSSINIIDSDHITFIPPANAAGEVDIVVRVGVRVYHHPGYYTYIPELNSVAPNFGPTTGGTGFGASYNANGTATITGTGITNSKYYSDGTNQYYSLGWLDFDGSQAINTGANQLGDTIMTLDAVRDSGQYAAGVLVAGNYFTIILPTTGFMLPTANYGNANATAGGAMNPGDHISATLEADGTEATFTVSLNGGSDNTNQVVPTTVPSTAYSIYLGSANNGAGMAGGMVGRIYGATIDKDNPADDRNFVPVCTMNGTTGGMFDTLHNVFYPSSYGAPFGCDNSSIAPPTVKFGTTIVPSANITVVDLNTIKVIPPAHDEDLVDVAVTANSVTATLANAYTYRTPLTIFAVDPPFGSIAGGTSLTITGHNFIWLDSQTSPLSVTLDVAGTPTACAIAYVHNDIIACTTSPHSAGLVTVSVNNSNSTETYTMATALDPDGSGMPTTDDQGRSTGGFLYVDDTFVIDLGVSTMSVDLTVSLSAPFDQDYALAQVSTNNTNGYRLYIESAGATLVCPSNSMLSIPSTVGNAIDGGTWGYQIGSSPTTTGWAPVPLTSTQIDSSSGPTFTLPDPVVTRDTRVNFAVRNSQPTPINTSCPQYAQTISYTVVANL